MEFANVVSLIRLLKLRSLYGPDVQLCNAVALLRVVFTRQLSEPAEDMLGRQTHECNCVHPSLKRWLGVPTPTQGPQDTHPNIPHAHTSQTDFAKLC